ncbi:AraC family transcriptional regulator, partial [Ancylobacter vacuolatus]
MDEKFDLFGHPIRVGQGRRGRPSFEPSEKDRNKIKLLLALGWSITRMANGIGVSPATVKRYFRAELRARDAMRDRLDARRFEIAMEQANAGNIQALKELGRMVERSDLMRMEDDMGKAPPSDRGAPAPERIGKKVIDKERALEADADLMADLEQEAASFAR